jgi:phosphoribosylamine---glycine ligase
MKILIVGSGGREHALAWAIASSPLVDELYCAPGNGGMAEISTLADLKDTDIDGIVDFACDKSIDFVVVGPEVPLTMGLVDRLDAVGVPNFGPDQDAAQLEGSKGFMKDLCADYDIPTATYERTYDSPSAKAFLKTSSAPYVIKADGLAAGKGVIIAETLEAAEVAVDEMFNGAFGDAGEQVVIEEFLEGEEASFFALTDGTNILPLIGAQDHKQVGDGDTGPNTGGMGAYSPAPILDEAMTLKVMDTIIRPTVAAMADKGCPFKGVLYAGLMICDGVPKLIEYNVRFGDPECQVLMARLQSDILPALMACHSGTLDNFELSWSDESAMCVVLASEGYPRSYEKGSEIRGLKEAGADEKVTIFHAGTKKEGTKLTAIGGRVLNVVARGATIGQAQSQAYDAVDLVDWPEGFCRRDIGWRALERDDQQGS